MARVVWLDDQKEAFRVPSEILTDRGHQVFGTTSETEALTVLETEGADLFIQDIDRPGMGGVEFLRAMRNRPGPAAIPVVIFSAYPPPREGLVLPGPRGGMPMPVQGWIMKLVMIEQLVDELVRVLREASQG